jgi:transcriptional regulator with XRE-family HTH domain
MWVFSGDRLVIAMKAKYLTNPEVAHKARLSNSMIEGIKGGYRQPSAAATARLADAVGCHPGDFFVQVDDHDDRPTELGAAVDAWIKRTLADAPKLTAEQAERVSAALFGRSA